MEYGFRLLQEEGYPDSVAIVRAGRILAIRTVKDGEAPEERLTRYIREEVRS